MEAILPGLEGEGITRKLLVHDRTLLLARIASELDGIARRHRVTVVECDAVVQRTYPYRGRLTGVHGRGGTDLRPPFAAELLRRVRPEVIVYFTDGYGPAPAAPPGVPVIWCLVPGGRKPAHWGRVILLPAEPVPGRLWSEAACAVPHDHSEGQC